MRLCFFADARNSHLQQLAPRLATAGHSVHVVTHKPVTMPGVDVERFRVPRASPLHPHRWPGRWKRYLQGYLRRFDAVIVFFLHDWGFTRELTDQGCLVASPRGSDIVTPPEEEPPSLTLIENRLLLLRHAASVGVAGPRFARMVAEYADIPFDSIDRLPLGVDMELFQRNENTGQESLHRTLRVGFLKGFRPVYGAEYLIRAVPLVLRRFPSAEFELVGDGPCLDRCQKLAEEQNVQQSIRWLNRRPHEEVPLLFGRWNLTVIPSVCESFGLAALESAAMGIPVVASRVGGLPDTVLDKETGLLVEPRSPLEMADAILRLLGDPATRRRMGVKGREWVRRAYAWPIVIRQWEETLMRAVERTSVMV